MMMMVLLIKKLKMIVFKSKKVIARYPPPCEWLRNKFRIIPELNLREPALSRKDLVLSD